MSEQQPELSSAETGSFGTPAARAPPAGGSRGRIPAHRARSGRDLARGGCAQGRGQSRAQGRAPKVEAPKVEAPKVETAKAEATKPEAPRIPGNVMIMSPGERAGGRRRQGRSRAGQPASAASPRWPPWSRWRRWRVRSAARWRPRASDILRPATRASPSRNVGARSLRGAASMPIFWR